MAERFMDDDRPRTPVGDWARRFDISAAGWALLDAHVPGAPIRRLVVYPINISLTGIGVAVAADLSEGTGVGMHMDRLVSGAISLSGVVRRCSPLLANARFVGIAWTPESRETLIEHLAPKPSDAALKTLSPPPSPEEAATSSAYRSMYAENRLGNWAATVAGD